MFRVVVKQLNVGTGYHANSMSITENDKETIVNTTDKAIYYLVDKFWILEFGIMLVKTTKRMDTFGQKRFFQLPTRPEHEAWKNPCNIPNNEKYISTYKLSTVSNDHSKI